MFKSFSKLPTQAVLLSASLLVLSPVFGKAELTDEQIAEAVCNGILMWASQTSLDGFVPVNMPIDENYEPLSLVIKDGLLDGNNSRIAQIYQLLMQRQFTNDLGQVFNILDVVTNQLSYVGSRYFQDDIQSISWATSAAYNWLSFWDHSIDGSSANVWVVNADEMGYAVGDSLNSSLPSLLGPVQDQLDEILRKLTPTNSVNISADEVNTTDEYDFVDTTDALSEAPYDDTSYSSPTNTDHFAGIGNPTLLDLPDPTSKLNDLSTSVRNLPQNDEIVFWDGESGTSADALGKVSVRLGEQGMVQTSGNVFVFAWNLLYAIFSGIAVWKFVLSVHPTHAQMQGKLF